MSFRDTLVGSVASFLRDANMACASTQEIVADLISKLCHYTEEGAILTPSVLICDDITNSLKVLACADSIPLKTGPKGSDTALAALKLCAPLATGEWHIFLERKDASLNAGIFREDPLVTSYSLKRSIMSSENLHAIHLSQIAHNVVELSASNDKILRVNLTSREGQTSPKDHLDRLCKLISRNAALDNQASLESFLYRVCDKAYKGHGGLVAVVAGEQELPSVLSDGTTLAAPLDLATMLRAAHNNVPEFGGALAYRDMVYGMLSSDGIVVFDDQGFVRAFNCFIRTSGEAESSPREILGGSRRRAFEKLKELTAETCLQGVFFQSSDGSGDFFGGDL